MGKQKNTRYKVTYHVSGYVNKYATRYFDSRKEAVAFRDKQAVKGFPVIPYTPRKKKKRKRKKR